ncbi:hypothetical protein Tco_1064274, partial [Tanacetum coccineum]
MIGLFVIVDVYQQEERAPARELKNMNACSLCGSLDHNKRRCPKRWYAVVRFDPPVSNITSLVIADGFLFFYFCSFTLLLINFWHEEKVFAEAEAVSEMGTSENEENEGGDVGESSYHDPATIANPGEKFSHDPTAMANPVLSDCVANGDQLSLESDLEALSLRLPVNPLHEQLNASSTILPAGAEKVAADVVLSGSISNVFVSEMIAVGDVIAQPVFEVVLNENEANESPESGDNQNTFQEVLIEASSNKTDRNKICESVVNDEVKVQKSLIKTSKEAGRNEPFEYHQISLDKSIIGPTSLIKSTSNETEGNEGGDVGKSSCHPTTLANLAESDVAEGDQFSSESALDGVSIKASSTILPAGKNYGHLS